MTEKLPPHVGVQQSLESLSLSPHALAHREPFGLHVTPQVIAPPPAPVGSVRMDMDRSVGPMGEIRTPGPGDGAKSPGTGTGKMTGRKRKISRLACEYCSKLHKRCDGRNPHPCSRCTSKGVPCTYVRRQKRGPKTKRQKLTHKPPVAQMAKVPATDLSTQVVMFPQFAGVSGGFPSQFFQNPQILHLLAASGGQVGPQSSIALQTALQPPPSVVTDPGASISGEAPRHDSTPSTGVGVDGSSGKKDSLSAEGLVHFGGGGNASSLVEPPPPPPPQHQQLQQHQHQHQQQLHQQQQHQQQQLQQQLQQQQLQHQHQQQQLQQQQLQHQQMVPPSFFSEGVVSRVDDGSRGGGAAVRAKVLLIVTGSVAAIKSSYLCSTIATKTTNLEMSLSSIEYDVQVVLTEKAAHFADVETFRKDSRAVKVFTDADEWDSWSRLGDTVLHIALRQWADICVIAPLSANSMAKIANGMCDNLATCIVKAWDFSKPMIAAPAMNTTMWNSMLTQKQVAFLKETLGVMIVDPVEKILACGESGVGAMATVQDIVNVVERTTLEYLLRKDTTGKKMELNLFSQ